MLLAVPPLSGVTATKILAERRWTESIVRLDSRAPVAFHSAATARSRPCGAGDDSESLAAELLATDLAIRELTLAATDRWHGSIAWASGGAAGQFPARGCHLWLLLSDSSRLWP